MLRCSFLLSSFLFFILLYFTLLFFVFLVFVLLGFILCFVLFWFVLESCSLQSFIVCSSSCYSSTFYTSVFVLLYLARFFCAIYSSLFYFSFFFFYFVFCSSILFSAMSLVYRNFFNYTSFVSPMWKNLCFTLVFRFWDVLLWVLDAVWGRSDVAAFLAVSFVGMHGETNMFLACGSDIMEMNVQGRRVTSHLCTPWPPAWQFTMLRYQRRTTWQGLPGCICCFGWHLWVLKYLYPKSWKLVISSWSCLWICCLTCGVGGPPNPKRLNLITLIDPKKWQHMAGWRWYSTDKVLVRLCWLVAEYEEAKSASCAQMASK